MTSDTLSEAEKRRRVPGIVYVDGAAGRKARLASVGIDVWLIIMDWRQLRENRAALYDAYHWVEPAQIDAALDFYGAFAEEIDARIAREIAWCDFLEKHAPLVPPYPAEFYDLLK